MNNAGLIQAVRGPIMMMTLGILMAIHNFGQFSFSRTWPLLIIVFGILKLAEHSLTRSEPYPPEVPGGGNRL